VTPAVDPEDLALFRYECGRKVRYKTKALAKQALKRMRDAGLDTNPRNPLNVYRCVPLTEASTGRQWARYRNTVDGLSACTHTPASSRHRRPQQSERSRLGVRPQQGNGGIMRTRGKRGAARR